MAAEKAREFASVDIRSRTRVSDNVILSSS